MTHDDRPGSSPGSPPAARPVDWWLEEDAHGVTARGRRGAVAHVEVREEGPAVQLVFWVDEGLPRELRTRLARTAFSHPAVRPQRPVSVALPHGETEVLSEVRGHLADPAVHVAGATCLLEGHVR
ncbi:hypothetical protein [Modestobacter sp. SSW1-42]|uniref:hypothetical protein n=1 Tax=Modestobacter sp. SSW1-42 TaxID=596372 RepID=UPI0039880A86